MPTIKKKFLIALIVILYLVKTQIREKAKQEADQCNLTAVRIMFIAYIQVDGQQHILPAVLSDAILDCSKYCTSVHTQFLIKSCI